MSTELLGVVVNDAGVPILPANNFAAEKAFGQLFFQTDVGKKFRPFLTDEVYDRLMSVVNEKRRQGQEITLDRFSRVVEDLLVTKDPVLFPPEPEPAEVVDDRPRNSDGTFQSAFQAWSESHSSADCANRAKTDPEYRAWRQGQYRVEGLQEGAYRFAGTPVTEGTLPHRSNPPNDQVADFARIYKSVPSERLRARAGRVTLDTEHSYTPQEYELLVGLACSAGLI